MGKYDDISAERLRADLIAFARLILRLDEEEDRLLTSPANLQRMLGELRQKLFAYEVHRGGIAHGGPAEDAKDPGDPVVRHSLRVVREALRRSEELRKEWDSGTQGEDDGDE